MPMSSCQHSIGLKQAAQSRMGQQLHVITCKQVLCRNKMVGEQIFGTARQDVAFLSHIQRRGSVSSSIRRPPHHLIKVKVTAALQPAQAMMQRIIRMLFPRTVPLMSPRTQLPSEPATQVHPPQACSAHSQTNNMVSKSSIKKNERQE